MRTQAKLPVLTTPPKQLTAPGQEYDIVLIGSDSIETVQRTHASYFVDGEQPALLDQVTKLALAHVEFEDAFESFTRARRKVGATSPRAAR